MSLFETRILTLSKICGIMIPTAAAVIATSIIYPSVTESTHRALCFSLLELAVILAMLLKAV